MIEAGQDRAGQEEVKIRKIHAPTKTKERRNEAATVFLPSKVTITK